MMHYHARANAEGNACELTKLSRVAQPSKALIHTSQCLLGGQKVGADYRAWLLNSLQP
jgi:hypothetical protein